MKLSMAVAIGGAGVLLIASLASPCDAGWFGFGGASKSSESGKAPRVDYYDPNRVASGSPPNASGSKQSSWGIPNLFGFGKSSASTSAKKTPTNSRAKTNSKSENTSWWSSWFKPKEAPPPKNTAEWMKLKPVRW